MSNSLRNEINKQYGCEHCLNSTKFDRWTLLIQYRKTLSTKDVDVYRPAMKMYGPGDVNCGVLKDKVPPDGFCDELIPRLKP